MLFVEMPTFEAERDDYFTDESFSAFEQMLADRPDAGALIPSSHGLRKVRWGLPGRGKRGGLKNVRSNLSPSQLGELARTVKTWYQ